MCFINRFLQKIYDSEFKVSVSLLIHSLTIDHGLVLLTQERITSVSEEWGTGTSDKFFAIWLYLRWIDFIMTIRYSEQNA